MLRLSLQRIVILILLWQANANPAPWRPVNGSFPVPDIRGPTLEPRQDSDDNDPDTYGELSSITKLAAIGDSYSAGIGAGDRLGGLGGIFDSQSGEYSGSERINYPSNRHIRLVL
jgi:hypothetical protein